MLHYFIYVMKQLNIYELFLATLFVLLLLLFRGKKVDDDACRGWFPGCTLRTVQHVCGRFACRN